MEAKFQETYPTIVIYVFFQKYILAGVAAGAVKE